MNQLLGTITNIEVSGNLSLVKIDVNSTAFTSIVIETPDSASYLRLGASVKVMFKETEVIISKDLSQGISLRNRVRVTVKQIRKGALLSELVLQFDQYTIRSIITSRSIDELDLKSGDTVFALIKTNEVMLAE